MENNDQTPKKYTLSWFCEELVKGLFIAISLFILQIAGTGILQAYLLPDRLEKEAEKMHKKFDEQMKNERTAAVKRESELIESLETLKKEYSEALVEMRRPPHFPPSAPQLPPPIGGSGAPAPIPLERPVPNMTPNNMAQNWKNINEQRSIDPEKKKLQYIQQHTKN